MRVLHLDGGREMRGGQRQVLALIEALGEEQTLLARPGSPLMKAALGVGMDVRPLSWAAVARLSRSADLVHAHDARTHSMAAVVRGAPLVVSRRVAFPIGASPLSRWKYRRAAHFIAVSKFVKGVLLEAGVDDDWVTVVYDGVKLPRPTSSAGDRVITVASGDPMKGADLVREAARLGGFEIRESSNLDADLPGAALLVYISRSEGLGSAALLAMAHGVPVVASNVGGLREIVDDGITGVLTANEPRSICAAIERALAERQTLGMNARRLVADQFTVAHMAEDTRRVYEKVLGC